MNWYRNLRVKAKLLISFIVVIVFVVALVVLAVYSVSNMDDSYSYLLEYPQKRLEYIMKLETSCSDMRRATTAITLNITDRSLIDSYWDQYEQAYESALDNINNYLESNNADTVRDPAVLSSNNNTMLSMKTQLENYKAQANKAVEFARAGDLQAANTAFLEGAPMITEVVGTIGDLTTKASAYTVEVSDSNTRDKDSTILIISIISTVIIILSIVIAIFVSRMISKPLVRMSATMEQVGKTGSFDFSEETKSELEKAAQGKDEISQTISSTLNAVRHFENVSGILQQVADGDLTAELTLLSDSDTMGLSLKKMIDNLNDMFSEIYSSTAQVSTASKQIADGAQSLAQGSTEQASAVEQLSASISDVANKTNQNAGIAREAAELSSTIKGNAEKGALQMEQMMRAVKEINEASGQIEKVIKVIDDIAFQTNILALNAAVEAARAGQHGKGFAVVAEEVRNLAAKSAGAAKETGGLIENSVEKANLGLNMATETSDSLKDIVEGINRSADIVLQIARSSDEQAGAIAQINSGIDQVAQVIQQNSATAEESAAASEEMSGQTNMLEQMISQFKLKSESTHSLAPPSAHKRLAGAAKTSYAAQDDYGKGFGKY